MADSTRYRIWNLPLYAQHVAITNEDVRDKLAAEGNSRFIIEPVPGFDISKELDANMEAYMTWCVMGAVAFYKVSTAFTQAEAQP